ncbi:2-aminomuconic semialdehyde dehydrogenase isoform X2 [Protobothrops mucrosquamatus]|uniref:2-aminomuconic semialdehyde dehydrogenase isoform X2 n=1 Tax=Protobothrops mucrosquamatus TaxID=103944 RepID=UPI000775B9CD|nr:2-aminomuconic semialdehyde dehydrogenase isoform X2 [Protobothrops mucrosquamatus]
MSTSQAHLILENYIGGQFVPCSSYLDSYDPSIGQVYCKVPDSGREEVEAAVTAAQNAFPGWSAKSPQERSKIMSKLADLIEENLESFAQAESKDQGKNITFARTVDIPRAIYNFRFFSSSILHETTECTQMDHMGCMHYTERSPVGIGFPPGVINVVFGSGPKAGDALVSHPAVSLISFTGSTLTGQQIIQRSALYCKKLSLELGGKNPAIIFEDANLDQCIPATVKSSFANQGEICLCTSRIFVQKSISKEFLRRFVEAVRKWKVGNPSDPTTDMGALISKDHLAKVKKYIQQARAEGAKILCGEGIDSLDLSPRNQKGYFLPPTVITEIDDNSCCIQDEIFGPVACVMVFDTEEEVIRRANGVKYGLAATVWSNNVGRIHRVAKRLQSGLVWTNCWLIRDLNLPFGGMKASGIGREGAKDSYEFFTEVKTVTIKYTDVN